jgi:hypothetical protein
MASFKILRLADVQEEEGAVTNGWRGGLLTIWGLLSWGWWRERCWEWSLLNASGFAPAADGGGRVVVVEGAGGVPRVLR